MTGFCPRAGVIWLQTEANQRYWMETKCSTWRCRGCREAVLSRFKFQVESGLLLEKDSYFITFTFRLASNGIVRDADSVGMVWRRFLRRFRELHPKMGWLKVIELTENGMPHLHVAMTGLGLRKTACLGKLHKWPEDFPYQDCLFNCLEHEISRIWRECSGDSYITHCMPIVGAVGAAAYMAKYVGKSMYDFDPLADLGFGRRWSKSNTWPGSKRVRLRGTIEKKWMRVAWSRGLLDATDRKLAEERNSRAYWMERVGDEKSLLMEKRLNRRRLKERVKGFATQLFADGSDQSASRG